MVILWIQYRYYPPHCSYGRFDYSQLVYLITTILSSLHQWSMQQPIRQRLKIPIIYYGLITVWLHGFLFVYGCFFWYLIFLVENWQNLVLSLLLAHHQCWAYGCVCLNMGCKSSFCKTTCRTSFCRNFMSFMYLLFWLVTKIWSEKKVHF